MHIRLKNFLQTTPSHHSESLLLENTFCMNMATWLHFPKNDKNSTDINKILSVLSAPCLREALTLLEESPSTYVGVRYPICSAYLAKSYRTPWGHSPFSCAVLFTQCKYLGIPGCIECIHNSLLLLPRCFVLGGTSFCLSVLLGLYREVVFVNKKQTNKNPPATWHWQCCPFSVFSDPSALDLASLMSFSSFPSPLSLCVTFLADCLWFW